jgi:hypothetical protein
VIKVRPLDMYQQCGDVVSVVRGRVLISMGCTIVLDLPLPCAVNVFPGLATA